MGFLSFKKKEIELNFEFKSSDHLRYENGICVSGPHGGAARLVKIEPNEGNFIVTTFNLDGVHPLWKDNMQMAPKPMKKITESKGTIVLRGYGNDFMGNSFADYGLTIEMKNKEIESCTLHMHDRNVDIKYMK